MACEETYKKLEQGIWQADLVVDSIFGTGIARDIEGFIYKAVDMVNNSSTPSSCSRYPIRNQRKTRKVMGIAIKANHTVSFGYPKRGHILYPGREYTGRLYVAPISLPQDSAQAIGVKSFYSG